MDSNLEDSEEESGGGGSLHSSQDFFEAQPKRHPGFKFPELGPMEADVNAQSISIGSVLNSMLDRIPVKASSEQDLVMGVDTGETASGFGDHGDQREAGKRGEEFLFPVEEWMIVGKFHN